MLYRAMMDVCSLFSLYSSLFFIFFFLLSIYIFTDNVLCIQTRLYNDWLSGKAYSAASIKCTELYTEMIEFIECCCSCYLLSGFLDILQDIVYIVYNTFIVYTCYMMCTAGYAGIEIHIKGRGANALYMIIRRGYQKMRKRNVITQHQDVPTVCDGTIYIYSEA